MLDPTKINDLRRRVLNNEPWTEEEMTLTIKEMVHERINNLETPKPKASKKKVTTNLDDLL